MLFNRRVLTVTALITTGFLSACASTGENAITRSWQVEYLLSDRVDECRYNAISNDLATELRKDSESAEMLDRLNALCPDMTIAFVDRGQGGLVGTTSVATSVSGDDGLSAESTDSNTGGSTGGDTGDNTGGSTGGDTGGNTGGSTGGEAGSNTGGDSDGGKGRGSRANNGGGNGSEGSSPGRGRGANVDE